MISAPEMAPQLAASSPEQKAPVGNDGGFSYAADTGRYEGFNFTPNPWFDVYLKMGKGLGDRTGVAQLQAIYESLSKEEMPRYLIVAGWAAAEIALVKDNLQTIKRLEVLQAGADCWRRAIVNQLQLNAHGPEGVAECSAPFRIALNLAVMPLLEGMVLGDMTLSRRKEAYRNCLEIANANAAEMKRLKRRDALGFADHAGFSHELNTLLAFNRQFSGSWFMLPSMSRADSGHYYREQTHDLLVVHQKWGEIKSVLPVEVKDKSRSKDRKRYKALMVFANVHLNPEVNGIPVNVLKALNAECINEATLEQAEGANAATDTLVEMVRGYYAGEVLSSLAVGSFTAFHDGSKLFPVSEAQVPLAKAG